jgi:hypothetical protein
MPPLIENAGAFLSGNPACAEIFVVTRRADGASVRLRTAPTVDFPLSLGRSERSCVVKAPTTAHSTAIADGAQRRRRCARSTRCSVHGCGRGAATRCTSRPSIDTDRCSPAATTTGARRRWVGRCGRAGADAIEYVSARDVESGLNVALYTPGAFAQPRPTFKEEWLCETRAELVSFYARRDAGLRTFPLAQFTLDGRLPAPAA